MTAIHVKYLPLNPPIYNCRRAKGVFTLDGCIDKDFWSGIPFTEPFQDISGPDYPKPRFRTRAKLCWDDQYLYIAALLEGNEIWASIEKRDSVIYYDNDFEIFMDPSSSTSNYMELEMNAINTQWDLMLTRPYRNGGRSVSCWDIKGVETAVYIDGKLNSPSAVNRFWSAEIRLPFSSLMETYSKEKNPPNLERCYPCRTAPHAGEFWRMNFSRVQWHTEIKNGKYRKCLDSNGKVLPEDNWVWAPTGLIDIHCPEYWGFVFFTENGETYLIPENEKRKLLLRELYYAEYAWQAGHGCFTSNLNNLTDRSFPWQVKAEITGHSFELSCPAEDGTHSVCLFSDSYCCIL